MSIPQVQLTDTFDQWRQKTNSMITTVNSLSESGDILSVSGPLSGEILVYDGTFFRNVVVHGDATLALDGTMTVTGGGTGSTKGRIYFAGNIRGLF